MVFCGSHQRPLSASTSAPCAFLRHSLIEGAFGAPTRHVNSGVPALHPYELPTRSWILARKTGRHDWLVIPPKWRTYSVQESRFASNRHSHQLHVRPLHEIRHLPLAQARGAPAEDGAVAAQCRLARRGRRRPTYRELDARGTGGVGLCMPLRTLRIAGANCREHYRVTLDTVWRTSGKGSSRARSIQDWMIESSYAMLCIARTIATHFHRMSGTASLSARSICE